VHRIDEKHDYRVRTMYTFHKCTIDKGHDQVNIPRRGLVFMCIAHKLHLQNDIEKKKISLFMF